jgi:hypothetical protein
MKPIERIEKKFGSRPWFNRIERGGTNREYIIYSNGYPYTEDDSVYSYAKSNKIKIKIIPIGG